MYGLIYDASVSTRYIGFMRLHKIIHVLNEARHKESQGVDRNQTFFLDERFQNQVV